MQTYVFCGQPKNPIVNFTTWPRSDLWRCSSVINIKSCYLERSINTHCIFLPTIFSPIIFSLKFKFIVASLSALFILPKTEVIYWRDCIHLRALQFYQCLWGYCTTAGITCGSGCTVIHWQKSYNPANSQILLHNINLHGMSCIRFHPCVATV